VIVAKPRIGLISALWLPKFGGAEQYLNRMMKGLLARNLDVRVFCGTGQKVGFDNGHGAVTRFVPKGDIEIVDWRSNFTDRTPSYLKSISAQYSWFNEAVSWCKKNRITVAIVCNPFQQVPYFHAREMYLRLQDVGIKTGIVHHDLPAPIENFLQQVYRNDKKTWEETATFALAELSKALKQKPGMEGYLEIGSPLVFNPDFIISNSEWVLRFIDPLNTKRRFVYHGPVDAEHWRKMPTTKDILSRKDGRDSWTYRILKGGWGDAFKSFRTMVSNSKAQRENRIEFLDYAKDMRNVYAAAEVMFFPSQCEGYGMAAVEPMFMGTPVVSSNYPAILEAVGQGAKTLCPFKNSAVEWQNAVAEVLDNRDVWSVKALERAEQHDARQKIETDALAEFLKHQAPK
jgi:glycosyltransferase involved in cell wall biosynthesis